MKINVMLQHWTFTLKKQGKEMEINVMLKTLNVTFTLKI